MKSQYRLSSNKFHHKNESTEDHNGREASLPAFEKYSHKKNFGQKKVFNRYDSENNKNKKNQNKSKFQGTCHNCGKKGHRAVDCWLDPKNAHKRPNGWKRESHNSPETGNVGVEICLATTDKVTLHRSGKGEGSTENMKYKYKPTQFCKKHPINEKYEPSVYGLDAYDGDYPEGSRYCRWCGDEGPLAALCTWCGEENYTKFTTDKVVEGFCPRCGNSCNVGYNCILCPTHYRTHRWGKGRYYKPNGDDGTYSDSEGEIESFNSKVSTISKAIDLTNSSNEEDEDMKPAAKCSKTTNEDNETGFVFVENIEGWIYPAK